MAKVVFFASDMSETAQLRRIRSVRRAGHRVASFGMRKAATPPHPDWPHVELGQIANERLWRRLVQIIKALRPVIAGRGVLADADLLVARNIDMLVLTWVAQRIAGRDIPVIYECLDIHGIFTRRDIVGRIARAVERIMLRRAALLVVSSPGFVEHYFRPVQNHGGAWHLLENKLWFEDHPLPRPAAPRDPGRPLVLGWVGAIRCGPSLDLLCATARACGASVTVLIRGVIHDHALPDFHTRIARIPNIRYDGPYRYPDGLTGVYGS